MELPFLRCGLTAVIADSADEAGRMLVEQLSARGCQVGLYQEVPLQADVVISLLAWRSFLDQASAIAVNQRNFVIANKIAARFQAQGGSLVMLQDTGGAFGVYGCDPVQAWAAGSSGLIKTAAREWPEATVKSIDLARGSQTAQQLVDRLVEELFHGGPEIEVGLSVDGNRITIEVKEERNAGDIEARITKDSVLMVSGGARGVTAACLIELAKQFQPHLALLGRTPLEVEPKECHSAQTEAELKAVLVQLAKINNNKLNLIEVQKTARNILAIREINATLQTLRQAGAKVEYLVCDVQQPKQLQKAIAHIHLLWGPVTGIIHGAGVLMDKLIKDKTEEQFAAVFNTKVKGLQALLDATVAEPLNTICLFSSVVGRFGNVGQCDYAMANEILNKVAQAEQYKRGHNCSVKSLNWNPWLGGGMIFPALIEHFRRMDVSLLPLDTGVKLFVQELTHFAHGQTEVVLGNVFPVPRPQLLKNLDEKSAYLPPSTLDIAVNQKHSYLLDHSIKNMPVVPICLALEWFMRAAKQRYPDHAIKVCEDLKVLKPIRLDHLHEGHFYCIEGEEQIGSEGTYLKLSLRSKAGVLHYTANILLHIQTLPLLQPIILSAGKHWPWTPHEVYEQKIIFHGPAFQVIQSLTNLSLTGGEGTVCGIEDRSKISPSWGDEQWMVDVAMLDGGLQMCWLWNCTVNGPVLPMAIKRVVIYEPGLTSGPVRVVLQVPAKNELQTTFNVQYFLADGRVAAEISGLVGIALPSF